MDIRDIDVWGWKGAILGMRYPMNSENKSDSTYYKNGQLDIGANDFNLFCKLVKSGESHRKFLRFIHVQAVVKMPMLFWNQYDTYKIATVANSRSKMHKFGKSKITLDDFQIDAEDKKDYVPIINKINRLIRKFNKTKNKRYWKKAIKLLPHSYLQERYIDLNYEVLLNILKQREGHKLSDEWSFFSNAFMKECYLLEDLFDLIRS